MLPPGKLLLSAAVALLLLGDAVTRTTATTTSNAFLRAAVDARTSEEPGSVKGNPKLDEERKFESFTSWFRGLGLSGRSSSVMKPVAAKPVAAKVTKLTQKEEKALEAKAVLLEGYTTPPHTPAGLAVWLQNGYKQQSAHVDEFVINYVNANSKLDPSRFENLLRKAGVNDDLGNRLVIRYRDLYGTKYPRR